MENRLREAAERLTPQRKLIARILHEQGGHLSAEEIHDLGRRRQPRLSLATVYRTLKWLKEAGLVHELRLNGDYCRYEVDHEEAHQHMVCLGCGKIIEFVCDHCATVHSDLAHRHGFTITGVRVKLYGYCAECQKQNKNGGSLDESYRHSRRQ
jgi:Fur family ferric uptake transcriptional regulator